MSEEIQLIKVALSLAEIEGQPAVVPINLVGHYKMNYYTVADIL